MGDVGGEGRRSGRGVDHLSPWWSVLPGSGIDGSTAGLYQKATAVLFLALILYLDDNLAIFAVIEQIEP